MEFSLIALKKSAWLDRCSIVPNSVVFGVEAPNDRARFVAFGAGKSLLLAVCALEKLDFQCRCWYTICSPQQRHSTGRSPSHHEGVFRIFAPVLTSGILLWLSLMHGSTTMAATIESPQRHERAAGTRSFGCPAVLASLCLS